MTYNINFKDLPNVNLIIIINDDEDDIEMQVTAN